MCKDIGHHCVEITYIYIRLITQQPYGGKTNIERKH